MNNSDVPLSIGDALKIWSEKPAMLFKNTNDGRGFYIVSAELWIGETIIKIDTKSKHNGEDESYIYYTGGNNNDIAIADDTDGDKKRAATISTGWLLSQFDEPILSHIKNIAPQPIKNMAIYNLLCKAFEYAQKNEEYYVYDELCSLLCDAGVLDIDHNVAAKGEGDES